MQMQVPKGRGDIKLWIPIAIWLCVTVFYISLTKYLLSFGPSGKPDAVMQFPFWLLIFYGLIWSPINSYISARMLGLTGTGVTFPFGTYLLRVAHGVPCAGIG